MKEQIVVLGVVFCLFSMVSVARAEQQAAPEGISGEMEAAAAIEVGNKICPVSGEKVGEMGEIIKQEYNGKVYNFCCTMCLKDFNKDPEKFSKIAEDEVAKAALQGADSADAAIPMDEGHDHDHK